MKVVILAGGSGTRISEETHLKPKPLIEIGDYPIIWHIMKTYSFYGLNEFIICCGYKGNMIKDYFLNYFNLNKDFEINLSNNKINKLSKTKENWKIKLIDTGDTLGDQNVRFVARFKAGIQTGFLGEVAYYT